MGTATKERTSGIELTAGVLKIALAAVWAAVPGKTPRPVLHNVRIGDGLVTGTDLELWITHEIDYQGDAILLPAERLKAILNAVATDSDVTITPHGAKATVKAARGKWELPTEDAAEYPTEPAGDLKAVCRLPVDQFRRAVRATAYATDVASSRYALGAILLEVKGGDPTFVATDGRRLAVVKAETDQAVDDRSVLMPTRAAIAAMAGDGDSVQVETDGKCVVFTCGTLTVTGMLIDGKFPRWRDAVPERPEAAASTVNREQLLAATRAAAIVTSEQSKGVMFTFGKSLTLEARSAEAGESRVTCEVENAGDAGKVRLDPRFVVEYLRSLDGDADPNVTVEIASPGDAVVLRCDDVTGVIMPLSDE